MNKKLLFILILAFFIRLIALNQSLWLDEATTAKVVKEYGFTRIIREFSPNDFHPPLYYIVMKAWTNVVGYSEAALRFPSIMFSLAAGVIIYKIAKLLDGYIVGIFACIFFLFNPLIIYYSQEARQYMMVTFLLSVSLYCFLGLISKIKNQKLLYFIGFNLFSILSFYTFYGSIFLITSFLLYFLYKKQNQYFFYSLFIILFSLFILSPLLSQQLIHAKQSLQVVAHWSLVLGKASIKNLLLIPLKFTFGRISFYSKWVYYLVVGGWTVFILYQILKIKDQKHIVNIKYFNLFIYLFLFPLLLGFVASFFSPLLQYFRFLYLIPILAILLSFRLSRQSNSNLIGSILVGGFVMWSLIYLLFPQFHREDWKSLVFSMQNKKQVYMILPSSDPVKYYNSSLVIKELRTLEGVELEKQITIIPHTADIYGFDYKKELAKRGFTFKEQNNFRGVWYEIWVKNIDYAGSLRYSLITAKTSIIVARKKAARIAIGGPNTPFIGINI